MLNVVRSIFQWLDSIVRDELVARGYVDASRPRDISLRWSRLAKHTTCSASRDALRRGARALMGSTNSAESDTSRRRMNLNCEAELPSYTPSRSLQH
jgi:hypothetical protein